MVITPRTKKLLETYVRKQMLEMKLMNLIRPMVEKALKENSTVYSTPIKMSQFDFVKRKKSYDYPESHKTQITVYAKGLTKDGLEKYLVQKQPNEFGISVFNSSGKEIEFVSNVNATKTYKSSLEYFNKL
jgi:hypothetical protein